MYSNLLVPCVVSLLVLCSTFGDANGSGAAPLSFKVSRQYFIEGITQELSFDCRPSNSLHNETLTGLLIDIVRHDVDTGTPTFVARQLTGTHVMEDNRTTADGHMKTAENSEEATFINVNIKDPGLSEVGVYTCRYIYLDSEYRHLSISTNVTVRGRSKGSVVAFSVGLTNHKHLETSQKVVYDKVYTNVGGGYDSATGIFSCPEAGIYVIQFHCLTRSKKRMFLSLHHNQNYVASIYGFDKDHNTAAGNSVILRLAKDDQVFIAATQTTDLFGTANAVYGTFSGYLISSSYEELPVVG